MYHSIVCLGGLRNTTKNFSQDSQDSNQEPRGYKPEILPLHRPLHSVYFDFRSLLQIIKMKIQELVWVHWSSHCVFTETAAATRVSCRSGGIYQGWAAQPEEGIPSRTGGGEAHPECSTRHRAVFGGCWSEYRHCREHNWCVYLCEVTVNSRGTVCFMPKALALFTAAWTQMTHCDCRADQWFVSIYAVFVECQCWRN